MIRLLEARTINEALGGAVVGPGDIDGLQDDVIEACYALVHKVREYRQPKGVVRRGKKSS